MTKRFRMIAGPFELAQSSRQRSETDKNFCAIRKITMNTGNVEDHGGMESLCAD